MKLHINAWYFISSVKTKFLMTRLSMLIAMTQLIRLCVFEILTSEKCSTSIIIAYHIEAVTSWSHMICDIRSTWPIAQQSVFSPKTYLGGTFTAFYAYHHCFMFCLHFLLKKLSIRFRQMHFYWNLCKQVAAKFFLCCFRNEIERRTFLSHSRDSYLKLIKSGNQITLWQVSSTKCHLT